MLKSIWANSATLLWAMLLLTLLQSIAGLVLGQVVQSFITDDSHPVQKRFTTYEYFGTFTSTMLTMFEITHTNFAPAMRVLTSGVGEWTGWLVVVYRVLVSFAVLSVIQSVFIQQTLAVAASERNPETTSKAAQKKRDTYAAKLHNVFKQIDREAHGQIPKETFVNGFTNDAFKVLMASLDIGASDSEFLFEVLDTDRSGFISLNEFVSGALRLQGTARAVDIVHVMNVVRRLERKMDILENLARTLEDTSVDTSVDFQI